MISVPSNNRLLQLVRETCNHHQLITPGNRLLVAVSGGIDSVVLLHVLNNLAAELSLKLIVAHIDHNLRGAASAADAELVQKIADELNLPCIIEKLNIPAVPADKKNSSPESQWRDARYAALAKIARGNAAAAIALGHHCDDLAETVLMRIIRGGGSRGLSAFAATGENNKMRLIRPFYDVSRELIESYCKEFEIEWREDQSNQDQRRLRNQVRHDLLPLLKEKYNPSITQGLARTAEVLRTDESFLEDLAGREWNKIKSKNAAAAVPTELLLEDLSALPLALLRRIFRLWIMEITSSDYPPLFNETQRLVELVHNKNTGARFELQRHWVFTRQREKIVVK